MSAANDFDFLHGRWTVHHRRLRERGAGATEWQEFDGTAETRSLLGGAANIEEHVIPGQDFAGIALRTFSSATRLWSIYWVSRRKGELEPPVVGGFTDGVGRFEGVDCDAGRLVRVRFLWQPLTSAHARWQQSFSYDDGTSWETNWTMDFRR